MKSIRLNWTVVLLALILALAFVARTYPLNFPRYHWDENTDFGNVFYASFHQFAMPAYNHGSFFIYLIMLVWSVYLKLGGIEPSTQNLLISFLRGAMPLVELARGLGVLAGTGTVAVVYFLGKRMYGSIVGLLAAFFLALTFLHVSESHYARDHVPAVFFVTLATYFCARILDGGGVRDYVLAGVSVGLATAAQYSMLFAFVSLLVAHAARVGSQWREWRLHRPLLFALDSSALAFFIVTPYALLDFYNFVGEMKWWLSHELSRTWVDPEGQPVLLFYLTEHLGNGMGFALLGVALAGVVYALWRHQRQDWLWIAFLVPLFLTLSKGPNLARYALPLLPFLALAAARLLRDGAAWAQARLPTPWTRVALTVVAILLVIPSALNTVRFDYWLTQPDTRALAADWILANVPDGATIAVEGIGVLGPPVPPSRAQVEAEIAAAPSGSYDDVYLRAVLDNLREGSAYQVNLVFRLDQRHDRGILVGAIASAQDYADRGIDYLVTTDWMQHDAQDHYAPEFQESLDVAFERIAEFEPTVAFRFDPFAWRMDYTALAEVTPRQPGVGGPRLRIYRRRGLE